jgi:hypothetical protein
MLLDQTFGLQEGREQVPLVARSVDRVRQALAVVEGLEKGGELVVRVREWRPSFPRLLCRCRSGWIEVLRIVGRRGRRFDTETVYLYLVVYLRYCRRSRCFCRPARGSFGLGFRNFLCAC